MGSGLCVPAQWTRAPATPGLLKPAGAPPPVSTWCPLGHRSNWNQDKCGLELCLLSSWSRRDAVLPPRSVVAQRAEKLEGLVCLNPLLALPLIFCVLPLWQSAAEYFHGTMKRKYVLHQVSISRRWNSVKCGFWQLRLFSCSHLLLSRPEVGGFKTLKFSELDFDALNVYQLSIHCVYGIIFFFFKDAHAAISLVI